MGTPTVSIIMPNHNYAHYVADAIASVRNQTLTDWECIIIDDASTDDSVSTIRDAIADDDRFTLIETRKRVGIAAARNRGLDMARGEYIAFLDSDDLYTEHALEMLVHLSRSTGVPVAGGRAHFINGQYKYIPRAHNTWASGAFDIFSSPTAMLNAPQEMKFVWIWRRIYRRDLIGDLRFPENLMGTGEDLYFMLNLAWRITGFADTPNAAVYHRVHPSSATEIGFASQDNTPSNRYSYIPFILTHLRDELADKYNSEFLHIVYSSLFSLLMIETMVKTNRHPGAARDGARRILVQSCKLIPRQYLTRNQRFLCWYLSWMK